MATTATLVYGVTPQGPVSPAQLQTAVGLVLLPFQDLLPFGVTLASDVTSFVAGNVIRTIVFNLDAAFNLMFPPSGDPSSPFWDLYTHILGNKLSSKVTANAPLIA